MEDGISDEKGGKNIDGIVQVAKEYGSAKNERCGQRNILS